MIRFKAILTRVVTELIRDKRTLLLMMLAPLLLLTLMNVVFDTNEDTHLKIGVDSSIPASLIKSFPTDKVKMKHYHSVRSAKEKIGADDLDAFIYQDGSTFHITYENEDPNRTAQIKTLFSKILTTVKIKNLSLELQQLARKSGSSVQNENFKVRNSYVYGDKDSTFFDKIFPVLIGFFVFFFVFLISGIALLRERTSGTLERLLATPVKRSELVMGYLVGYGFFAVLQTLLVVFYAVYLLKVEIAGHIGWVLVTNILLALTALAMGIFVSTFANSEFQMIQFIPIVVIPQIFFSGIIPLESMNPWVRNIGYLFPLNYAGKALTNVMIKGQGLTDIWIYLVILALFVIGFTLLNILGLKRYRKV